jgi:hypothetical protein
MAFYDSQPFLMTGHHVVAHGNTDSTLLHSCMHSCNFFRRSPNLQREMIDARRLRPYSDTLKVQRHHFFQVAGHQ